jgi:sporulation protein YlmC with PRC-barrel domain
VKKLAVAVTASVLGLTLVGTASAQTTRPSTESTPSMKQGATWAPEAGAVSTGKLIGTRVKNDQGKDIGEIDQLIVDPREGKITHVVIGSGGLMGVAERKVVLPWSEVKLMPDPNNRDRMAAGVEQSKLEAAPRFEARGRDTAPAASPATSPRTR